MSPVENSQQLAEYVLAKQIPLEAQQHYGYTHMGAIISDAILQAGMNYRTVVAPRVNNIIATYPEAYTTSIFLYILQKHGANNILNWNHFEKPRRLLNLTEFLIANSIETYIDFKSWLEQSSNAKTLLSIKGIGLKTIDYIKNLVSIPTVAVDRHIRNFVSQAGIDINKYEDIRQVVELSARNLEISPSVLDYAIWKYMSSNQEVLQ